MAESRPNDAPDRADDAKVREEWQRLERQRLDEEIAEAREDAGTVPPARGGPRWFVWLAFAVALAAGIVATGVINGLFRNPP